jgi:CBS domain-containing protein
MLVEEAMNRNAPKIHDKATIKEAAERMALTQAGELVVVEAGDRVLGMIGAEEILRCLIPEYDMLMKGEAPARLQLQRRSTDRPPHTRVKEVMRVVGDPLVPGQTLEEAFGRLQEGGGRTLPVVNEGKLAGSLSATDIARALMWRDRVSPAQLHPREERRKG